VTNDIFIGGRGEAYATKQFINIGYANRHRVWIAGATGHGQNGHRKSRPKASLAAWRAGVSCDVKRADSIQARAGRIRLATSAHPFSERAANHRFDNFD